MGTLRSLAGASFIYPPLVESIVSHLQYTFDGERRFIRTDPAPAAKEARSRTSMPCGGNTRGRTSPRPLNRPDAEPQGARDFGGAGVGPRAPHKTMSYLTPALPVEGAGVRYDMLRPARSPGPVCLSGRPPRAASPGARRGRTPAREPRIRQTPTAARGGRRGKERRAMCAARARAGAAPGAPPRPEGCGGGAERGLTRRCACRTGRPWSRRPSRGRR